MFLVEFLGKYRKCENFDFDIFLINLRMRGRGGVYFFQLWFIYKILQKLYICIECFDLNMDDDIFVGRYVGFIRK